MVLFVILCIVVIESVIFGDASGAFPESTIPTRPFVADGYASSLLDPLLCPPLIASGSGSSSSSSGSSSGALSSGSGSGSSSGSDCPDPWELLCPICSLCVVSLVYNEDICTLCESISCDIDYNSLGSGSGSTSFFPSVSLSDFETDQLQCPVLLRPYRQICRAGEIRPECDYPTYIANFCSVVMEVCEENLSPGSGFDCESLDGLFCQSVTANTSCLFAYSEQTCSSCSTFLDNCGPIDIDLTTDCTDPSTALCNTFDISLCFGTTRPADTCDYCAYVGNECFTDSQEQLCTVNSLVEGCSEVFDADYPCECFFPSIQCQLCETVLRVCEIPTTEIPTNATTTSGPSTPFTTLSETTGTIPTNGTATTTVPSTALDTTLPVTVSTESTLPPTLVIRVEDLTDQEKEGSVTSGFGRVKKEEFINGADKQFRVAIKDIVNKDILKINKDGRRKRQTTGDPVPVTADDVRYISPSPFVDENDVLQIVFFVESTANGIVNGNDLAQSVQNNGAQLANTLGDSLNITVEFAGVVQGIPDTIAQPPATTGSPTASLGTGAIVGIIIASIAAVAVLVVLVVVAIVVTRKRDRKYVLTTVPPPRQEEIRYAGVSDTFKTPTRSREEKPLLDQTPAHMSQKTDTLPITAFIESNPGARISEGDEATTASIEMSNTHL